MSWALFSTKEGGDLVTASPQLCQLCVGKKPHLANDRCGNCYTLRCDPNLPCNCSKSVRVRESTRLTAATSVALITGQCQVEGSHFEGKKIERTDLKFCLNCGRTCCPLCRQPLPESIEQVRQFLVNLRDPDSFAVRASFFTILGKDAPPYMKELLKGLEYSRSNLAESELCNDCADKLAPLPRLESPYAEPKLSSKQRALVSEMAQAEEEEVSQLIERIKEIRAQLRLDDEARETKKIVYSELGGIAQLIAAEQPKQIAAPVSRQRRSVISTNTKQLDPFLVIAAIVLAVAVIVASWVAMDSFGGLSSVFATIAGGLQWLAIRILILCFVVGLIGLFTGGFKWD